MSKWLETYKTCSVNSYFKNGKWYVTQYFSEGYRDDENNWVEGDYAVDTENENYEDAVDEGYDKFVVDMNGGTIIEYNNKQKELPENATPEKKD